MSSTLNLPQLLRFKKHCNRGLKQQGQTCYFISTINTFLLSDGLYHLALHRLNDFYEEIKSNPTLVKEWLDTKELCLSNKFINKLMINDIETLDAIVAQNEPELEQSLSGNKKYDDFVSYFKEKLNTYQSTELKIKQSFLKNLFTMNTFDKFYKNFNSKWNNTIVNNHIYKTPSKETFLNDILNFTENKGNYQIARYAFYNILRNHICDTLIHKAEPYAIQQMHHRIIQHTPFTKMNFTMDAGYPSLVFSLFLHIMYSNQYHTKVVKIYPEEFTKTQLNEKEILLYKSHEVYEMKDYQRYMAYTDALQFKITQSTLIHTIYPNVPSDYEFDNASIHIKFIDTYGTGYGHAISMVKCSNRLLLIDSNYPDLVNYGATESLKLKDENLFEYLKPVILTIYNKKEYQFNRIESITYDHICFIRRSTITDTPLDINILRQKLCRLEPQIHGGALFKKQPGKYVTHNGRTYCLYFGKHNKHYIQQKGQMVAVSELKKQLKPTRP